MLHLDLQLKYNELFLVGRARERGGMHEAGLFARDTRFLSHFETRIQEQPLEILNIQQIGNATVLITASNPAIVLADGNRLQNQSLLIEQRIELSSVLSISTIVRNFDRSPVAVPITFEFGADFRDMFDVRGMAPIRRVNPLVPQHEDGVLTLLATGSDDAEISTTIDASPPPDDVLLVEFADDESSATYRYDLDLSHGELIEIDLSVSPHPIGQPLKRIDSQDPDFAARFRVASDSPELDAFVRQCDADLALLHTSFPEGNIPAAGIPWFIAPFGRDSLIVALQTMHAYPGRSASTLRVLAALQGTQDDPWREEEPGKILHEMRYGDMARSGQAPHSPYYGSIDSTPLFVATFAQHYLWHEDAALWDELIGNVRRALDWIESRGDLDGDGLIEFGAKTNDDVHISQQGWKDSFDSLHFADGREVEGPIALVEVQGYVYAAYAWLAQAATMRGEDIWAQELATKAAVIRETIEDRYWMEDVGYYAQALDGAKRQVDAISSNPGHLLFCRVPSQERADRVAAFMALPELNCGWGIRTLGSSMATYNPLSYHNGSMWPHDSSLAIAGLCAYGHHGLAEDLVHGLVALSHFAPDNRLAELYCGFPLAEEVGPINYPVNYPVSCIPQAWAAATGLLTVRALLDIRPDRERHTVITNGVLPTGLSSMQVQGIEAFGQRFAIEIDESGTRIERLPS